MFSPRKAYTVCVIRFERGKHHETQKQSDPCGGHAGGFLRVDGMRFRRSAAAHAQQSAEPSPEASAEPKEEAPIPLWVDGREAENAAVEENGALLLPLIETGEALGWTAESEELTEETQIRRSVALTKDNSKISVTWMVSDNTASAITWQKDGLLIPVDTRLTTLESVVYVPAAFFEEAMDASVMRKENAVEVSSPESTATPETMPQEENKTE